MGSGASNELPEINKLHSSNDIANLLSTLGSAYHSYLDYIIENGIDGYFIINNCTNEEEIMLMLNEIGITKSVHIKNISTRLLEILSLSPRKGLSSKMNATSCDTISQYQWIHGEHNPAIAIYNVTELYSNKNNVISSGIIQLGQSSREVIIKSSNSSSGDSNNLVKEVEILNKLEKSSFWTEYLHFHDVGPTVYVVLEKFGINLSDYLKNNLVEKTYRRILFKQLCYCVKALHDRGVMHGDLKPQNILIKESGGLHLKLCDFDNSCIVGEIFPCSGTNLKFTKEWTAPELFKGRATAGGVLTASLDIDIFSLGLVCSLILDPRSATISAILPVDINDEKLFENEICKESNYADWCSCADGFHYKPIILKMLAIKPADRSPINTVINAIDDTTTVYYNKINSLQSENKYIKEEISEQLSSISSNVIAGNDEVKQLHTELQSTMIFCEEIGAKINSVVTSNYDNNMAFKTIESKLEAQSRMLNTLIDNTHGLPSLIVIFPSIDNKSPVQNEYRLFFMCSYSLQLVPCGKNGDGYIFTEPTEWLKKAAPVLKVGLSLLRIALSVASGFPVTIPGSGFLSNIKNKGTAIDDVLTLLGTNDKYVGHGNNTHGPEFLSGLYSDDESVRSAYYAIATLMEKLDKNLLYLHMVKKTSKSGITKWIRNDPKIIDLFEKFNGERPPPPKPTRESVVTDKATTTVGNKSSVTMTEGVNVIDTNASNIFSFCNSFPSVTTTRDHAAPVLCCDISIFKDRSLIASGGADKLIKLWNVDIIGVTCLKTLFGHNKEVRCVKFYLNGDRIISASGDKSIKLWDPKTGQCMTSLDGHTSIVYCLSVCTDGSTIISSSADRTIKCWSLLSQKNTFTTNESAGWVESLLFHPKLKYTAVYGTSEAQLRKIDCELGNVSAWHSSNNWHKQGITALAFNTTGTHLFTGSRDNTIKAWSFHEGIVLFTINAHSRTVNSLSFAENFNGSNVIISGSRDGSIKITDVDVISSVGYATTNVLKTLNYSTSINSVLSVESKMLISTSDDCFLRLIPFKQLFA